MRHLLIVWWQPVVARVVPNKKVVYSLFSLCTVVQRMHQLSLLNLTRLSRDFLAQELTSAAYIYCTFSN